MQRETCVIHGIETLVTITGEGRDLLCLHGWGASHESFTELRAALQDAPVRIIAPDMPGFGESATPDHPWSVDDYADFVEELVDHFQLQGVLLLGHSFGGRISIKLASRKRPWITHLFLCAAAGIRRVNHFRRTVGLTLASLGNAIFGLSVLRRIRPLARKVLYKVLRVHDYEKTNGVMQKTMVRIIDEDLTPLLQEISVPTDLFWGEDDGMTPLADGRIMNTKIVQSVLHTFPGVRHRVHRDRAKEIAEEIRTNV